MSTATRTQSIAPAAPARAGRIKFVVGGLLMIAAIVALIISNSTNTAQYYLTVEELVAGKVAVGENVRISGAVDGATITYNAEELELIFTVAHVPGDMSDVNDQGGFAAVLRDALANPDNARVPVVYYGPMPDLMQGEAQAIMDGHLGEDGVFYADTLLLKCPTRYEDEPQMQFNGN